MARPYTYTPRRRLLLQLTLVALLAAVIGLAVVVRNQRMGAPEVVLSQKVPLGPLVVSLPSTWQLISVEPAIARLQAEGPFTRSDSPTPRTLEVVLTPVPPGTTAEEFLWEIRRVRGRDPERIEVAGQEGIALFFTTIPTQVTHLYAVAILPGNFGTFVHLQVPGDAVQPPDALLLERVANELKLMGLP